VTASIRAAAYFRKSTDQQKDSIDRQRAGVTAYAGRRGFTIIGEYVDEGIAGDVFDKRPGFQRLLRDAARDRFDVIVVDEPSRLSRQNPVELIEKVVAPLRRAGIKLDTASKGPLDYESLAGLIMMTVNASKAVDEVRDLARRTLGGIAKRARAGLWFGWAPPYGLRIVREIDDKGKVVSRKCVYGPEEEVRAVRFIFDAVANRGWTLRRVCLELKARGVRPPTQRQGGKERSGHWNRGTVRKMLRNRKYVGDLPWNETHIGKYFACRDGEVVEDLAGPRPQTRIYNDAADVVVVAAPDLIPPIIDRDTFARAGAALSRAGRHCNPGGKAASYLFTRVLTCGDCGGYMRGQPSHGRKTYICSQYKEGGTKACSRNTVGEQPIKDAILGALLDEILSPDRLNRIEQEMERRLENERQDGEADRLRQRVEAIDRDLAQGNARLVRIPEDRLAGVIAQMREWEGERAGLLTRIGDLENGPTEAKAILDEARKQLWRLRESLEGDDEEAQATVVREVVSRVEVRFERERTPRRVLSKATALVLYVRPGLGLSELVIPGCRSATRRRRSRAGRTAWTGRRSARR
jgi:DNA invertase Pin-like site-specific DNA recombinase